MQGPAQGRWQGRRHTALQKTLSLQPHGTRFLPQPLLLLLLWKPLLRRRVPLMTSPIMPLQSNLQQETRLFSDFEASFYNGTGSNLFMHSGLFLLLETYG